MTASRSSTEQRAGQAFGRPLLGILAVLCGAGAVAAYFQLRPANPQAIHRLCERLAGAIAQRDAPAVEKLISPAYRDGRGFDRTQAIRHLFLYLDARGYRTLTPLNLKIDDVTDNSAHATMRLWLSQAELPPRGRRDAVQIDLSLHRETGSWRVVSAEDWQLPLDDFEQPED